MLSTMLAPHEVYKENEDGFIPLIDPQKFSTATNAMRAFFLQKGFVEVHTQNRLSILAACENPSSIATYEYSGKIWPLPQTGQMWLEYELLTKPNVPGYFCVSNSYRNEKNPIKGRHHRSFPMFEFETHGGINELEQIEKELVEHLGFGSNSDFPGVNYEEMATKLNVDIIESDDELKIAEDYGPVFFLKNFPERTHPFWNMKRNPENPTISHKIDVLLHGMETIGSAERSCDAAEQRHSFYTIEDGNYAKKLFNLFGKQRVEKELEDFLSLEFVPRSGGGIGITRMMRAMVLSGLL